MAIIRLFLALFVHYLQVAWVKGYSVGAWG